MPRNKYICPVCGTCERHNMTVIGHVIESHPGFLQVGRYYYCMCGEQFSLAVALAKHWRGLSSDERGVHLMLHRLAGGK